MEPEIAQRVMNRAAQLTHIQHYISKLDKRGHLVTLYQDMERIMEIEKETNKIEVVMGTTTRPNAR